MSENLELLLAADGETIRLLSPHVGVFTCALPAGAVLEPGGSGGVLLALGRSFGLVVPAGGGGSIVSSPPAAVRAPVGFGDVLYEITAGSAAATRGAAPAVRGTDPNGLVLRAPQSGRFYRRPSACEPEFTTEGQVVEEGQPVGLIEVMKTFGHVPYHASGGLPRRAKVVRFLVADGADVKQGEPLLEVEPA